MNIGQGDDHPETATILAALELAKDLVVVTNARQEIVFANQTARAHASMGDFDNLFNATFGDQALEASGFWEGEMPWRPTKDGEIRSLSIRKSRLPTGGIIVIARDVTDIKARVVEALTRLVRGITHDFNNVLGAISGFAQLMVQDTEEHTALRRFAQRIVSAAEQGHGLVGQMRRLSRPGLNLLPRSVLVVDTDPAFCGFVQAALERLGHDVVSTADPQEAMAALSKDPKLWDLLVTDPRMAHPEGGNLVHRARAICSDIHCIICTAPSSENAAQTVGTAGAAVGYLAKPVALDGFLAMVDGLFQPSSRREG